MFYLFIYFFFILFARRSIHQGNEMFRVESRGGQEIYSCLAALLLLIFDDS